MKLNLIDLGPSSPWAMPIVGQQTGTQMQEGDEMLSWSRGSIERKQTVGWTIIPWQAIGDAAANTGAAAKYLLKQVEELLSNPFLSPIYVQWTATAAPGGPNSSEMHDGWYIFEDFEPDYGKNIVTGPVQCRATATQIKAKTSPIGISRLGGGLSSTFSMGSVEITAYPSTASITDMGSAALVRRAAGGNDMNVVASPVSNPIPLVLASGASDLISGGVRVYDTINTGTYPVPTSGGRVDSHWVEVFWKDHVFVGDIVIENDLILLVIKTQTANLIANFYCWNGVVSPAAWTYVGDLQQGLGLNSNQRAVNFALDVMSHEEVQVTTYTAPSGGGAVMEAVFRLKRGHREVMLDAIPLSAAGLAMFSISPAGVAPMMFNSGAALYAAGIGGDMAVQGDYGYIGAMALSTGSPIYGFLLRNQPTLHQGGSLLSNPLTDDRATYAINSRVSVGLFAAPYGINGSFTTADLFGQAFSGSLGTGWSSHVDGVAISGHNAAAASGTASGNADLFGTVFSPSSGTYDVWVRAKVTSAVSGTPEMTIGVWDPTAGSFVASGSTNFAPNQFNTTYTFVRAATALALPAAHATQFRAVTTGTLATTWTIDVVVLVPKTLSALGPDPDQCGPADLWQQYLFDASTLLVRI